ncbi:BppU family phage baseplate upper protein [Anaerotignum propionicum]|uniref:BppU N-terminal domain-containing protein n=1 Tax=Anaerotignum propionicum DSM 1682 TaxID=991789 RepID=A0ABM5YE68_ANAPI|nr:BppU family phage baseplate upper protein [Anaerotignum propionicum]AMJ41686.1 hypothetical protein CPRO_21060 [Anaerotignum propionicum DSM 1682]AMJ42323.1 hypothetical protein CPRO_27770 [Anaerotignum propionicum DSM 1682]
MAQVYKKLEIDVNKEVTSIITAVQNDTKSRYLDVILLDGSTAINLTGHEVRIYGKKADGTEFYNNGAITNATAGRCQFELTSQALAVAQDLEVQIILYKNNLEVLSTQPFKIHIVKSLISAGAVESSNEYGALVVLYQNLYEAHDLMTTMVQNIGVPGEIAGQLTIDTMWDAWEYLCNYVSKDLTTLLQNAINNNSVDGVVQRLGNTADTGGTATAGTVMGKLNALINKKQMFLSRKMASVTAGVSSNNTTVINGAGLFYSVTALSVNISDSITISVDGKSYTNTMGYSSGNAMAWLYLTTSMSDMEILKASSYSGYSGQHFSVIEFNNNLTITYNPTSTRNIRIFYALYE